VQKTDVNLWNLQTAEATPVAAAAVMTSSEWVTTTKRIKGI
jgi:hypothetical protein